VSTPRVIPTIDDTPKEPRIKPKRCPACQRPNKPDGVRCSTCGYNLDAPPPPVAPMKPGKAKGSGGGLRALVMLIPFLAIAGGAGSVAYFGVDKSLAYVESFYKKPALPPTPQQKAQATALDARRKILNDLKEKAGNCFTQFNDLMERGKQPVELGPTQQALQRNTRELESVAATNLGCNDMNAADPIKTESCDTVVQLKTCLSTVMNMERERIAAATPKPESSK